ncbi:MAG: phosphopantothenoylcysteine decarboxylase, partial [Bacteroidales bacterium]|nr:phosphopantothenoylcysteine decarboxylase [Bacteroidales bacterium]
MHIGFALESQNLLENAKKKMSDKGVDLLVANSTKAEVSPFGGQT